MVDQRGDDGGGVIEAEVHAHLGELEADVGVELVLGNGIEEPVVDLGGLVRLAWIGDVFAKAVEGDGEALRVEVGGGGESVLDTKAGDKARRHAAAEAGLLSKTAKGCVTRETDEGRTQQGHFVREANDHSCTSVAVWRLEFTIFWPGEERFVPE